jgi:hypothetical protein
MLTPASTSQRTGRAAVFVADARCRRAADVAICGTGDNATAVGLFSAS